MRLHSWYVRFTHFHKALGGGVRWLQSMICKKTTVVQITTDITWQIKHPLKMCTNLQWKVCNIGSYSSVYSNMSMHGIFKYVVFELFKMKPITRQNCFVTFKTWFYSLWKVHTWLSNACWLGASENSFPAINTKAKAVSTRHLSLSSVCWSS